MSFYKISVTICGKFYPDDGYVSRIRTKYTANDTCKLQEYFFQTCSHAGVVNIYACPLQM